MRSWMALLRYNLMVVLSQSVWLIIIPVAATQLLVLWFMAMASMYKSWTPVQVAELLAPMLAAFLAAHALGSEYRYRAEEVLLCKPTSMARLLWQRLLVFYGFLALLIAVVLSIFHFGIHPRTHEEEVPLRLLLGAGLPSTLFLSMLALALATLFRNPMMGWLLAGLYWGMDLLGGVRFHPLLSLQTYASVVKDMPLGEYWLWSKILLIILALAFYLLNGRWLRSPEGLRRREQRRRAYGMVGLALVFYLYSGALAKVHYGLQHEEELGRRARAWYQDMFQVYRGLPIARAFGGAFAAYVFKPRLQGGDSPERLQGMRQAEVASLTRVVERYPASRWADNALFSLAQAQRGEDKLEEALASYDRLIRKYPDSVFAPMAMQEGAELLDEMEQAEQAFRLREQLLQRYPSSWEIWPAVALYAEGSWRRGQGRQAADRLQQVAAQAPDTLRGLVHIARAELFWKMGDPTEARQEAEVALPYLQQANVETTPVGSREVNPKLALIRQPVRAALSIADALKKGHLPAGSLTGLLKRE